VRKAPRRVAVLGFDAAASPVVHEELEAGRLPHLRALLERGTAVSLRPASEAFPGSAWPTTTTGVEVDEHGLHFHRALEPGTYRLVHQTSEGLRRPPFWRHVSDAGLASVVIGVYGVPVLDGFRGVQAIGWGLPDPFWRGFDRPRVEPKEARRRLAQAVGRRVRYYVRPPRDQAAVARYHARLLRGAGQQTDAVLSLAERGDWSLLVAGYSEVHHGGHLLWHLEDGSPALESPLRDVYRAIDAGIGRVVAALPSETTVFVLTPHGMGRSELRSNPIEAVLERGGWLVRGGAEAAAPATRARAAAVVRRVARATLPFPVRSRIRLRLYRGGRLLSHDIRGIDWTRTSAFSLPADLVSYVRLNVAGREPNGALRAGERRARGDEIAAALHELRIADTGAPAVRDVIWCEDAWDTRFGTLPDLVVLWAADRPMRALRSPRLGTIELPVDDPRTGHHRPDGFVIGAGPGIETSAPRWLDDGEAWRLVDVAPTILSSLGVASPPWLAGRPIAAFA
jgi:predicted AlkP superfamily phosphohydrolase/phosphomutase